MRLIPDEALAAVAIDTEAENQPYQAKVGVAEVIRNRMTRKFRSNGTLADTLWRKSQFSAFSLLPDPSNLVRAFQIDGATPAVFDCVRAWAAASSGSNTVSGALLFYSIGGIPPPWAIDSGPNANFIVQLGSLKFYRA